MAEKTQEEKDKEELELRRLKDIMDNREGSFYLEAIKSFQELMRNQRIVMEDLEKIKQSQNQIIDFLNSQESKPVKTEIKELKRPVVPTPSKDPDEDDSEEIVDEDEDDLGFETKG